MLGASPWASCWAEVEPQPHLLLAWPDEAAAMTLLLNVLRRRDRKESLFFVRVDDGTDTVTTLLVLWIVCTSSIFFF